MGTLKVESEGMAKKLRFPDALAEDLSLIYNHL